MSRKPRDRTASVHAHRCALRMVILGHLQQRACVDCGEADPVVLDFDHNDPDEKLFSIGNGVAKKVSVDALQAEIDKCTVRCSNCHRRRTAKQFNWFKYRLTN